VKHPRNTESVYKEVIMQNPITNRNFSGTLKQFGFNGIILDSDVIIELYQQQELEFVLSQMSTEKINVCVPKNLAKTDNFKKSLADKINTLVYKKYLNELEDNVTKNGIYKKLSKYPLDEGELNVYTLAEINKLLPVSNDKIPAYSYLVYKNERELRQNKITPNDLLENFYGKYSKIPLNRISNAFFLQCAGYPEDKIKSITRSNRRSKEWFTAKEIAAENKALLKLFSSERKFYLSIGSLAASVYALEQNTNPMKFEEDRHYDRNIGLKIKSTNKRIKNKLLTRRIQRGKYQLWQYNNIAYNSIIKYMKSYKYLIPLLNESRNSKYIGILTSSQLSECKKFVSKFRHLFHKYRLIS